VLEPLFVDAAFKADSAADIRLAIERVAGRRADTARALSRLARSRPPNRCVVALAKRTFANFTEPT
jgi:hypothetical protein